MIKNIQSGTATVTYNQSTTPRTNLPLDISISPVSDLSKTSVKLKILYYNNNSSMSDVRMFVSGKLTSEANLQIFGTAFYSGSNISWEVDWEIKEYK